jgi:hypothetical protein
LTRFLPQRGVHLSASSRHCGRPGVKRERIIDGRCSTNSISERRGRAAPPC